jgi:glycosyltransferase involved in cell wall biosynthesis
LAGEELGRSIEFHGHVATAAAFAAMQAADFGVVSLHREVFRYAFPSKTMTYLAAGCPVLAVVEPESELARVVKGEELGYVAGNDAIDAIAEAMHHACDQRAAWTAERRRQLQRRGVQLFGQGRMLAAWSMLLKELSPAPPLELVTLADAAVPQAADADARAA